MAIRPFKEAFLKLVFAIFAILLPLASTNAMEEVIREKRIKVAMRMIGHEILMSLGDCESRILPIEKIDKHEKFNTYRIPFEREFSFDPADVVLIINDVMRIAGIANSYFVEVEQCQPKAVVHSYEVSNTAYPGLIPCDGRILPKDCYRLLLTIIEGTKPDGTIIPPKHASNNSDSATEGLSSFFTTNKTNPLNWIFLLLSTIGLIALIAYRFRKKDPAILNPDLVLIGASQFDKKKETLSFANQHVTLSNKEAALLALLHASANKPIEREVILQQVWGDEGDYVGRTLDVFISKLRKKFEADSSVKIINIRGVGYKLVIETTKF